MENIKRPVESDVDYDVLSGHLHKRIRMQGEFNFKNDCETIVKVLKNEFKDETSKRQQELHVIQKRLLKAQKTLHLLKYIVIKSFYDRNYLKTSNVEESVVQLSADGSDVKNLPMLSQERIHPAIKKLIGKTPLTYEPHRTRTQSQFGSTKSKEQSAEILDTNNCEYLQNENTTLIGDISHCTDADSALINPIRNRQKIKYQIVIGNISKWIPMNSNSRDSSTHKWMIYVRGPRDSPDISHIVKKIRFFLHPSYQPNDIVELEEQPFHLSRRGWGEFPLRVQIHFQCRANKPVDVIHNLKLDRTYTGRQTLGNETLINVWLYNNDIKDECSISQDSEYIADNCKYIKTEINDELHDNRASEYVTQTDKQLIPTYEYKQQSTSGVHRNSSSEGSADQLQNRQKLISLDTNKHISNSSVNQNSDNFQSKSLDLVLPSAFGNNNPLNYRIKYECSDTNANHNETNMKCDRNVKEEVICDDKINVDNETKVSSMSGKGIDTNIATKKKQMYKNKTFSNSLLIKNNFISILKSNEIVRDYELVYLTDHCYTNIKMENMYSTIYDCDRDVEPPDTGVIDSEKYKIYLKAEQFSSSRQIVYFLFKSLPLVTKLATDPSYRCHCSYTASSLNEFSSWHRTKRFCSEWFRAKHIKNILINHKIPDEERWTVKIILMFGRAHAFTPLATYDLFKKSSESGKTVPNRMVDTEITSTFTEHTSVSNLMNTLHITRHAEEDNCIIDVECLDNEIKVNTVEKDYIIDTSTETEEYISPCTYIRDCAKDLEIHLKPEEILPGISCNLNERVLLQAIMCLAEELIRRAFSHKIVRNKGRNLQDLTVDKNEVLKVLLERPEFDIFLNEGLGRSVQPPTSNL